MYPTVHCSIRARKDAYRPTIRYAQLAAGETRVPQLHARKLLNLALISGSQGVRDFQVRPTWQS
jgi:hypothetical protein